MTRSRRIPIALAAALLVTALVGGGGGAATAQAARGWKQCGHALPYQDVTVVARRVECRKARAMLREVYSKGQEVPEGQPFVPVFGFRCFIHNNAYRMVACRRGKKRVLGPLP